MPKTSEYRVRAEPHKRQYKVRKVTRYLLTEHIDDGRNRGSSPIAFFDNAEVANDVAVALAKTYDGDSSLWETQEA